MSLAAIILADQPDDQGELPALYPFGDDGSLIEWQIAQVAAAGVRDIELVLGANADALIPLVASDNVEPIINPAWQTGIAASMRVGATAVPRGVTHALIVDIREPRPARVLTALIEAQAQSGAPLVRPAHAGTPGTPLLVTDERIPVDGVGTETITADDLLNPVTILSGLRNVRDDADLERVLAWATRPHLVPFPSNIVLFRASSAPDLALLTAET